MKYNNFKAIITDADLFEDLIWMSYRYCIGRKTIAAYQHASNIAKNLYNNIIRKDVMAGDIRSEINDMLRWNRNIHINVYTRNPEYDAFTLIIEKLIKTYGNDLPDSFEWDNNKYTIENDKVFISDYNDEKPTESINNIFTDALPWIKLANSLDTFQHKVVVTEYNGKKSESVCFKFPVISIDNRKIDMRWIDINTYLENPFIDTYISPEYIIDIKDIA